MVKISGWEYFKKRWLYYLSFIFIYIIPGIMIALKIVTINSNETDVTISFSGFILGLVYIAFVAKKVRIKISEMKPGALKILAHYISNIIPFLTVGFLVVLVKKALNGFDYTVWAICAFMFFGALLQALEWMINKRFLYNLEIEKKAREKFDVNMKLIELKKELENE